MNRGASAYQALADLPQPSGIYALHTVRNVSDLSIAKNWARLI